VPIVGTWAKLELAVTLDSVPRRIDLFVNGQSVVSQPTQIGLEPKPVGVNAGIAYSDPTPELVVDIDDVTVHVE
jgi:hypothetical protein